MVGRIPSNINGVKVVATIKQRVSKLEGHLGATEFDRWLKTASDEQLEARIAEVHAEIRRRLEEIGIACAGLSSRELLALAEQHLPD